MIAKRFDWTYRWSETAIRNSASSRKLKRLAAVVKGRVRTGAFVLASAIAIIFALNGYGVSIDENLRLMRDLVHSRPATGRLAIVELDARSLDRVASWPWPRAVHARLIDRLRDAQTGPIAMDIDFSATTDPANDTAFAAALARSGGGVILPTFRQPVSSNNTQFSENLPIPAFRDHAFLASVNVQPDRDGQLRTYSYGTVTADTARPSLAAMLADVRGTIGHGFRIDSAIDPKTIPRFSAIDILEGRIPRAQLQGRSILIGATAIEMGDRYIVPGQGILPGVVVQALAAETLMQGAAYPDLGPWPGLIFAAFCGLICLRRSRQLWNLSAMIGTSCVLLIFPLALEMARVASLQIVPALSLLTLYAIFTGILKLQQRFRESRFVEPVTGLPNARALEKRASGHDKIRIIAFRIKQFDEMSAVLSIEDRAMLIAQIVRRLHVGFPGDVFHAADAGVVAWQSALFDSETLVARIESASALFRAAIDLEKRTIVITPAFGSSTGMGSDARAILAQANLAARHAQERGLRMALYSDRLAEDTDRSLALVAEVDDALDNGDIYVVFQPKLSVATGLVCGAEALVRWRHPQIGPIGPDEFIPLLETSGHINSLTLKVIDSSTAQLKAWQVLGHDWGIAVNISATLLDDADFVEALDRRLRALGPLASSVTLEVTESATIGHTATAIAALVRFRNLEAKVSIDDYGTGHATLTYLKSFPADEIKIDKSFVTHLLETSSDQILVRSTIELAHELGFKVVAEGVETNACLEKIAEYGCDIAQGWAVGRPVSAEEFTVQFSMSGAIEDTISSRLSVAA